MWPPRYSAQWTLSMAQTVSPPIQTHSHSDHFANKFVGSWSNEHQEKLKARNRTRYHLSVLLAARVRNLKSKDTCPGTASVDWPFHKIGWPFNSQTGNGRCRKKSSSVHINRAQEVNRATSSACGWLWPDKQVFLSVTWLKCTENGWWPHVAISNTGSFHVLYFEVTLTLHHLQ